MRMNVLLSIENYITSVGLATIISDGIIASKITNVTKEEVIKKINDKNFDIVVFDYQKNNSSDFDLINQIVKTDPKIKLFILTSRNVDSKIVSYTNRNNIGLILDSYSYKSIIKLINFSMLNNKTRAPFGLRKKAKNQNVTNLLSDRELEIALMLIKGETLTTISDKNNLALTTISTYKKRIFEKIKVKNLIELSLLLKKHHVA